MGSAAGFGETGDTGGVTALFGMGAAYQKRRPDAPGGPGPFAAFGEKQRAASYFWTGGETRNALTP
jgi:hypothetical protein